MSSTDSKSPANERNHALLERIRRGVDAHGPKIATADDAHLPWAELLAHRFDGGDEPAQLAAALEHLDGCSRCQREALAIDPTLMFRRLSPQRYTAPNPAPADVETMKHDVATLRRARALSGEAREDVLWRERLGRRMAPSRRFAAIAAAMILAVAAGFGGAQVWTTDAESSGAQATETTAQLSTPGDGPTADGGSPSMDAPLLGGAPPAPAAGSLVSPQRLGRLMPQIQPATDGRRDAPLLEGTDRPHARVYSSGATPEEDVAVVMVIDSGFDV